MVETCPLHPPGHPHLLGQQSTGSPRECRQILRDGCEPSKIGRGFLMFIFKIYLNIID